MTATESKRTRMRRTPEADPGLKALNKLVGTWRVSGDAAGKTTYAWMDGGRFLIQHGTYQRDGTAYKYMRVIGYEHAPGDALPSKVLTSRVYTDTGDTLDYTSEIDEET